MRYFRCANEFYRHQECTNKMFRLVFTASNLQVERIRLEVEQLRNDGRLVDKHGVDDTTHTAHGQPAIFDFRQSDSIVDLQIHGVES